MTEPARMIAYLRVSTDDQAASGLGLEAQESTLRRTADFRGWQLVATVRDEGISASTLERPGLWQALAAIARGDADGLVVAKLDRLTRSQRDFCAVMDWFADADAQLVVLEPEVDMTTPAGRAFAQVFVSFGEYERGLGADRTRAALAAKRARGEGLGRPSVADRPELVARIRALLAEGNSQRQVADQLNDEGVPTARGAEKWTRSSIQTAAGYQRRPPRRHPPALPALPARRLRGA